MTVSYQTAPGFVARPGAAAETPGTARSGRHDLEADQGRGPAAQLIGNRRGGSPTACALAPVTDGEIMRREIRRSARFSIVGALP
jgi:hypothetical protein